MKAITLRLSDTSHAILTDSATDEGVPLSQYVREAALLRAVVQKARAGDYDPAAQLGVITAVRAFLEAEDKRRRPKP